MESLFGPSLVVSSKLHSLTEGIDRFTREDVPEIDLVSKLGYTNVLRDFSLNIFNWKYPAGLSLVKLL